RLARGDRFQTLVNGGGAGRAGILHARRGLETKGGIGLQDERGGEILRRKAAVEMAEQDFVDVAGANARVGERILRHPYDQTFNGLGVELAEGGVREANDTGGHCRGSWKVPDRDGIHIGTLRGGVIQARNCTCAGPRAVANPPSSSPTPDLRTDFPLSNKVEFRPLRLIGLALAATCLLGAPAQAGPYLLVDYASGRVIAESD